MLSRPIFLPECFRIAIIKCKVRSSQASNLQYAGVKQRKAHVWKESSDPCSAKLGWVLTSHLQGYRLKTPIRRLPHFISRFHAKLLDLCKLAIDLTSVWYHSGCRRPKEYDGHLRRLVGQSVRSPITHYDGRTSTKVCPFRSSSDMLVGNFIASHEARFIRAGAGRLDHDCARTKQG